jgi:DNA-binding NarL/FixJ family response regulator
LIRGGSVIASFAPLHAPAGEAPAARGARPATVLVVAADVGLRTLLTCLLKTTLKFGTVADAGRLEEAIRLTRELGPDVVLADAATVGLGARRIKAERPQARVVLITSSTETASERALEDSGADGALDRETLVARLWSSGV